MGKACISGSRYVGKIIRYCPLCDRRTVDCICKVTKRHEATEAKTEKVKTESRVP